MRVAPVVCSVIALLLVCAAAACSDTSPSDPPPPQPTIGLSITPSAASVNAGETAAATITVSRGGGYSGPVSLALEGAPADVSGVFTPTSLTSSSAFSSLALNAALTAPPGNHNLTVRASGDGVTAVTTPLALIVAPRPAITVALGQPTLSLVQGTAGSVAVQLGRTNFTGAVALSTSGASAGVTATVAPASTTGDTARLNVAVATTVDPGTYTIAVTAQAQGIEPRTAAVTLTVVVRPSIAIAIAPTSVTLLQGSTGSAALTITRTNFTGAVTLSAIGAPAGVTATVSPASTTGGTAALALTADSIALLGSHTLTVTAQGDGIETRTVTLDLHVATAFAWAQLTAAPFHTCGVSTSGAAYCWGLGSAGQLGNGATPGTQLTPVRVSGTQTWAQISANNSHTCGVTTSGDGYCWGWEASGRLGNGVDDLAGRQLTPAPVSGGHRWQSITAGNTFSCGITTTGDGYCWGAGELLGDGIGSGSRPTPSPIAGGHRWSSIEAQRTHACGITTSGAAWCWGLNLNGVFGNGSPGGSSTTPVPVSGGHTWASITAGLVQHSCGVTTAGSGYCWGYPVGGVLGRILTNYNTIIVAPALIDGGHTWRTISAGQFHTCGVTTAGVGYCWGEGAGGRLGHGVNTGDNVGVPTLVAGGHVWASIVAGADHSCGLTTSGRAYCWGPTHAGKIGAGAAGSTHYAPTEVTTPTGASGVQHRQ